MTLTATRPIEAETPTGNGHGALLVSEARTLKVPAPSYTTFEVELTGITPLITDSFSDEAKDKLALSQDGSAKVKPGPRQPEREFENSIYRTADGQFGVPPLAFMKAIRAAATRMSDVKGTVALAALQVNTPEEVLALDTSGTEPTMRRDHVVRVGRGNLAYRAQFWPWKVVLPLRLDHEVLSLDQAIHLLFKAGAGVGIGNWRPEKNGTSGTFAVTAVENVKVYGAVKAEAETGRKKASAKG